MILALMFDSKFTYLYILSNYVRIKIPQLQQGMILKL
jgi:hypothetical protein